MKAITGAIGLLILHARFDVGTGKLVPFIVFQLFSYTEFYGICKTPLTESL